MLFKASTKWRKTNPKIPELLCTIDIKNHDTLIDGLVRMGIAMVFDLDSTSLYYHRKFQILTLREINTF